jgi:hypothetical protein
MYALTYQLKGPEQPEIHRVPTKQQDARVAKMPETQRIGVGAKLRNTVRNVNVLLSAALER